MWETATNLHLANLPSALLAAVPMVVTLGLFVFAQRRLPRDDRTVLFELFLFGILWWQGFDMMVRLSATAETAAFWRGLLRFGQIFTIPVGMHFALTYAELENWASSRAFNSLLYTHAIVLFGFYQNGVIDEQLVYHPGWGWLANGADFSFEARVMLNLGGLIALATTGVLVYNAIRLRAAGGRGSAAMLIAVGHGVVTVIGVFTEVVLPTFGIHQIPITSTVVTVFTVCVALALTRFHMFAVSTPATAKVVLETITDPMLIARADGRLLFANRAAMNVFPIDAIRIQDFDLASLFPTADDAHTFFAGRWKDAVAGSRQTGLEVGLVGSEDKAAPYLVSLAPIPITRQGEPGVAIVAHDVSQLKAVERDLVAARDAAEAANVSKSMFLANMSHELRTPLNAIIGYSELLGEDVEDEASADDLGRIEQSGRYLLALINDILDLAKVESGKLEAHPTAVDLRGLLDELVPSAEQMASRNGNRFELDMPENLQPVFADRIRTRQILLNLLSNASKFTERGRFGLRVRQDAERTVFDVWDTGIGMNEAQLAKLFASFSQVHETNHGKYGGTGLGLALSRRLCQLMNGDIEVTSQPGEGSTFTVHLPTG